jgi:threonine/homoserine/homoserine lactone efflux protein
MASPFQVGRLAIASPRKLIMMGLLTNLLNPNDRMLYPALPPPFIDPAQGSVLLQSRRWRR